MRRKWSLCIRHQYSRASGTARRTVVLAYKVAVQRDASINGSPRQATLSVARVIITVIPDLTPDSYFADPRIRELPINPRESARRDVSHPPPPLPRLRDPRGIVDTFPVGARKPRERVSKCMNRVCHPTSSKK